jgi:uncharacterized Ntn-hydrolase superfamily protein
MTAFVLNTFSITARCPRTGMLGVAVATKLPAVGALCPYVRAGAGAIASQSLVNPFLGLRGLELLAQGVPAQETLERILAGDAGRDLRQVAVVDRNGGTASFTGGKCEGWHGTRMGSGYVATGNFLTGEDVIESIAHAFESSEDAVLPERLVRALEAGQAAGGDKRGKQSAALRVAWQEEYPHVDLRVDDAPDPVAELRRIYGVFVGQLQPFLDVLPTRSNPAGVTDLEEIRAMARRRQQATGGERP